jgi:hypothetical protein
VVRAQSFKKLLVEVIAHDLVQRPERLVHQENIGIEGERAGNRGALLHAAGKLPGELLAEPGKLHQRQRLFGALALLGLGKAHDLQAAA